MAEALYRGKDLARTQLHHLLNPHRPHPETLDHSIHACLPLPFCRGEARPRTTLYSFLREGEGRGGEHICQMQLLKESLHTVFLLHYLREAYNGCELTSLWNTPRGGAGQALCS